MKTVTASLISTAPYSASQHIVSPRGDKESPDDYERRTWRERLHVNDDGLVQLPNMGFKNALDRMASMRSDKVKGKGQATYTKFFLSGVMVPEPLTLSVKAADVKGEWLFVPSDGKKGGGSRVMKCFPVIPKWTGDVTFMILDDNTISERVFEDTLNDSGLLVGVGRWRPERGGCYGRFKVQSIKWS